MRYLVAGGMGFLGSNLCGALMTQGHEVKCIDSGVIGNEANISKLIGRPQFDFEYYDVCHKFDCGHVDGIFHLASPTAPAETYKHSAMTLEVNSKATLQLIEMAEKYDAKFLFASSIKVNDRQTFGSTYIQGKILGEKFCTESGFAKVARMGNVYGPNMALDDSRVIPTFIRNTITGKPLNVWGDGKQIDSFCYVSDIVKALMRFMESEHTGVMELGSPHGITIHDLACTVMATNNVDLPIIFDQPGGASVVVCNNSAFSNNRTSQALAAKTRKVPNISIAQNYLRWVPEVALQEGITKTTEYYKEIMQ
jgi:nucleoside-diphosphate-sugar epimerase